MDINITTSLYRNVIQGKVCINYSFFFQFMVTSNNLLFIFIADFQMDLYLFFHLLGQLFSLIYFSSFSQHETRVYL